MLLIITAVGVEVMEGLEERWDRLNLNEEEPDCA